MYSPVVVGLFEASLKKLWFSLSLADNFPGDVTQGFYIPWSRFTLTLTLLLILFFFCYQVDEVPGSLPGWNPAFFVKIQIKPDESQIKLSVQE